MDSLLRSSRSSPVRSNDIFAHTWHNLFSRPLLSSAVGVYIAIRLLRLLNNRLSWYALNRYKKFGNWDPSIELTVVTGGGGGIGQQIVRDLTTAKVKVIVLDIQQPTDPLRKYLPKRLSLVMTRHYNSVRAK